MNEKKCDYCGGMFSADTQVCPNCGCQLTANPQTVQQNNQVNTKFCKHCGGKIPSDAVICTLCGRQVEQMNNPQPVQQNYPQQPQIVINNNDDCHHYGREINKWVDFVLCLFLGYFGAHKFYEGKIGMGVLYLLTIGLCGIGWIIDIFVILAKPEHYYVNVHNGYNGHYEHHEHHEHQYH